MFGPNPVQDDRDRLPGRCWGLRGFDVHGGAETSAPGEAAGVDLPSSSGSFSSLQDTCRSWEAELARTRPESGTYYGPLNPEDFVVRVSFTLNLPLSTAPRAPPAGVWIFHD